MVWPMFRMRTMWMQMRSIPDARRMDALETRQSDTGAIIKEERTGDIAALANKMRLRKVSETMESLKEKSETMEGWETVTVDRGFNDEDDDDDDDEEEEEQEKVKGENNESLNRDFERIMVPELISFNCLPSDSQHDLLMLSLRDWALIERLPKSFWGSPGLQALADDGTVFGEFDSA